VGTRDPALDSMTWPACAGRLRTFELHDLNWSGAKGTRTPGLLHAMNHSRIS